MRGKRKFCAQTERPPPPPDLQRNIIRIYDEDNQESGITISLKLFICATSLSSVSECNCVRVGGGCVVVIEVVVVIHITIRC